MKIVAIYMRVSTQNQENEATIKNQEMELREQIKADGLTLLDENIYQDDGWSGTILERPALDRLQADAMDKKFNTLYFYDRGRISRRFVHQEVILDSLKANDVECISLKDINGDSDEDRLMGGVMGLFQEYERLKITQRMRVGKKRKVHEDKMLLGYAPKFGYSYHRRIKTGDGKRDGYFSINEAQAEVVRLIFKLFLEGSSKYAIASELQRRNILPPKAKRDSWSTSVIDRMLRDSTYMGIHYYNKTESVAPKNPRRGTKYRRTLKASRIARPSSEWTKHKVDPIISTHQYEEAQRLLKRNSKFNNRNSTNEYLVSGLIECVCGQARTGDPANGRLYYRCSDRLNNRLGIRKCYERGVVVEVLDDVVWKQVCHLLTNPKLIIQQAKRRYEKPVNDERLSDITENLTKLDESEARYAKMYGNGMMAESVYVTNFNELQARRDDLNTELSQLKASSSASSMPPLEELLPSVIKLIEEMDFSDRKALIRNVVDKVIATKAGVTICGHIPLKNTEKVGHELKYRHIKVPTQLPFELKLRMPSTDHGGRGYSDEYITAIERTLYV